MSDEKPPKQRSRATRSLPGRKPLITIKGTPEWGEWVARFAEYAAQKRIASSTAELFDQAMAAYASSHGFEEEPPIR